MVDSKELEEKAETSISELEELCFEAGKLAEKQVREKIKIVNIANILGSKELDDEERESYIQDRKFVQENMKKIDEEFSVITEKRLKINAKINDAVRALKCQN